MIGVLGLLAGLAVILWRGGRASGEIDWIGYGAALPLRLRQIDARRAPARKKWSARCP